MGEPFYFLSIFNVILPAKDLFIFVTSGARFNSILVSLFSIHIFLMRTVLLYSDYFHNIVKIL